MSTYIRAKAAGASYFFTVVTYQRRPILCDVMMRNALRTAIQRTRASHPFTIDAWVIMPDHLHCIWTLPDEDSDFSTRWRMIKSLVSIACRDVYHDTNLMNSSKYKYSESTIWQRRFWEHQLRNDDDFAKHVDYLHFNPVKHGMAKSVSDWPYSTFHRYVKQGVYQADWGLHTNSSAYQYIGKHDLP